MTFKRKYLKVYIWEVIQFFLGAPKGKQSLYFGTLRPAPRAKILDVGCANGNASAVFRDYDYTGIDIDPLAIDFASDRFRQNPTMRFLCEDVYRHDKPGHYDYVVLGSIGHHIPNEEFLALLQRVRQLLKPGGIVAIFDPIVTGRESPWLKYIMSLDEGKCHKTLEEYLGLFSRANLTLIEQKISTVRGVCLTYTNFAAFKLST